MGTKFAINDRVRINQKTFPSFDEGLFHGLPKTGVVVKVEPDSILPFLVKIDTFGHHPFWFYQDQLLFEDEQKEGEWAKANAPTVKTRPGATAKPEDPAA